MGIIWFRWHNRLAEELRLEYPDWTDAKIYDEARKWVIASHQQIVINEWLPILLGEELLEYKSYDPSIDPQISHVFQSAAFRFGHTLVTAGGIKRNRDCSSVDKLDIIRTCNNYWKPIGHLLKGGFEELIMGMSSQPAEQEDNVVVEDLRGYVFGPLEFSRRDLMAIDIQRGRDHGLPDYLTARRELGLEDMSTKSIEDIAEELWKANIDRNPVNHIYYLSFVLVEAK
jgi:dual oxidase